MRYSDQAGLCASIGAAAPAADALASAGSWAVYGIREHIDDFIPPPLADSTFRKREASGGSDIPLLDTEQMYAAIVFEVDENAKPESSE